MFRNSFERASFQTSYKISMQQCRITIDLRISNSTGNLHAILLFATPTYVPPYQARNNSNDFSKDPLQTS